MKQMLADAPFYRDTRDGAIGGVTDAPSHRDPGDGAIRNKLSYRDSRNGAINKLSYRDARTHLKSRKVNDDARASPLCCADRVGDGSDYDGLRGRWSREK